MTGRCPATQLRGNGQCEAPVSCPFLISSVREGIDKPKTVRKIIQKHTIYEFQCYTHPFQNGRGCSGLPHKTFVNARYIEKCPKSYECHQVVQNRL